MDANRSDSINSRKRETIYGNTFLTVTRHFSVLFCSCQQIIDEISFHFVAANEINHCNKFRHTDSTLLNIEPSGKFRLKFMWHRLSCTHFLMSSINITRSTHLVLNYCCSSSSQISREPFIHLAVKEQKPPQLYLIMKFVCEVFLQFYISRSV